MEKLNMNNKWFKVFLFCILFCLTLVYTYRFRVLVDDELYGLGFGVNIAKGLVPYKDFNMIITPLFSYIVAFFITLFGKHLFLYHIIIAIIVSLISLICYNKMGYKVFIIYLALLIYPFTGYNMFSLLLLFFLINIKPSNKRDIIEVIIISLMVLTKQVLGILVIPSLIYSKNRGKSFFIYFGIGILFILSLVYNGSLYNFVDYCFLGMFDFSSQNNEGINIFFIIEIFIIIYLIYEIIRNRKRELSYILGFQIMAFPITNMPHFIISFIPFLYYILSDKNGYVNFMVGSFVITYLILFNIDIIRDNYDGFSSEFSFDGRFYSGRVYDDRLSNVVDFVNSYVDRYDGYRSFLFGNFAYLVRLNNKEDISKYDLINDGNMGYNGSDRYIEEIDDYCKNNKCLFITENKDSTNQTNKDIIDYVRDNYFNISNSTLEHSFEVYINN